MFYRKVNLDFYLDEEHITIHPHSIIVDPIVIVVLHFDEILLPPPFPQEEKHDSDKSESEKESDADGNGGNAGCVWVISWIDDDNYAPFYEVLGKDTLKF